MHLQELLHTTSHLFSLSKCLLKNHKKINEMQIARYDDYETLPIKDILVWCIIDRVL